MELKLVKITPAIAAEMLANNIDINRSIRSGHLQKLCSDMTNDLWDANNGETIKFMDDKKGDFKYGTLVDGQHRLTAIIQTGKTYKLPVLTGVSADAFATIDSGSCRTFADLIAQKGYTSKNSLAAGISTLEQFYIGNFKKKQLSHRQLLKRFEEHKSMADFVSDANRLRKTFKPSEAVFLSYTFNSIAPKKGAEFIQRLATGGAQEGTPIHELREKLISLRIRRPTGPTYLPKDYVIGSVFKAWNMTERKSKDPFTMLSVGEDIEYPVGFAKYFTDIEIGGIER